MQRIGDNDDNILHNKYIISVIIHYYRILPHTVNPEL